MAASCDVSDFSIDVSMRTFRREMKLPIIFFYVKRVQSWSQRPFSTSMFRKPNSWVHASSVPVSSLTDISIIFQVRVIGGDPRRPIMSIFWYFLLLLGISSGNYSCDSAFKWTPYSISIWLVCQFRLRKRKYDLFSWQTSCERSETEIVQVEKKDFKCFKTA